MAGYNAAPGRRATKQHAPSLNLASLTTLAVLAVAVVVMLSRGDVVFFRNAPAQGNHEPAPSVQGLLSAATESAAYAESQLDSLIASDLHAYIGSRSLATKVSVTHKLHDYTISLKRAYADEKVIMLGFVMQKPQPASARLLARIAVNGRQVGHFASGTRGQLDTTQLDKKLYETPAFRPLPKVLNIRVFVAVQDLSTNAPQVEQEFVVNVPVYTGTTAIISSPTSHRAGGVTLTLSELKVGPSSTDTVFKHSKLSSDASWWKARVYVMPGWSTGGIQSLPDSFFKEGMFRWYTSGERRMILPEDLFGASGKYTLVIRELVGETGEEPVRVKGPWIFKFELPANRR